MLKPNWCVCVHRDLSTSKRSKLYAHEHKCIKMVTINLKGCVKSKHIVIHLLVILFGISAWIGVNGIFVQLPILVHSSPEGSALPTYIVIVIQMANVGPIIYMFLQQRQYKINESLCILGILALGNISMALLIFFYDRTIILSNSEYSVALFILTFFTAFVGCFSSMLFMPYLRTFNQTYIISYFIGEGLSGVLPSSVALIQSIGGDTEYAASVNQNNTSERIILKLRFSPPYYFLFIFTALFLSLIAFIILQYSPFVQNIKITSKNNKKQTMRYSMHENPTPNGLYKENKQITKQVLPNDIIEDVNLNCSQKVSLYKRSHLFILMSFLCFFGNGFLPSIQLYSCLPYGQITYQLSTTLVQFANPIACLIAFWIIPLNLNILNVLSTLTFTFCTYVTYVALISPFVPLQESEIGIIIILLSWTILIGLISYMKLVIVSIFRQINKPNILFYIGIVMQAGSASGAIISFLLIEFTDLFQS